jgi:hypothetical protein
MHGEAAYLSYLRSQKTAKNAACRPLPSITAIKNRTHATVWIEVHQQFIDVYQKLTDCLESNPFLPLLVKMRAATSATMNEVVAQ